MSIDDLEKLIAQKMEIAPPLGAKIRVDLGDDGQLFIDGSTSPPVLTQDRDAKADTTLIFANQPLIPGKNAKLYTAFRGW